MERGQGSLMRLPVPDDFPQIRIYGLFRTPTAMFASGRLQLGPEGLRFDSVRLPAPALCTRRNLDAGFAFSLALSEIQSVDSYRCESPVASEYDLNFVRITTDRSGRLGDLLLCIGASGLSSEDSRTKTSALESAIRDAWNGEATGSARSA